MSKHPEDNIDQVLRDKLDGFQPELRPEVWEGISAGVQSGRGRRGAWMWWVGAAVLLLGIGAGLVTWFGSTGTEQAPELADSISDVTVNTPLEN